MLFIVSERRRSDLNDYAESSISDFQRNAAQKWIAGFDCNPVKSLRQVVFLRQQAFAFLPGFVFSFCASLTRATYHLESFDWRAPVFFPLRDQLTVQLADSGFDDDFFQWLRSHQQRQ